MAALSIDKLKLLAPTQVLSNCTFIQVATGHFLIKLVIDMLEFDHRFNHYLRTGILF